MRLPATLVLFAFLLASPAYAADCAAPKAGQLKLIESIPLNQVHGRFFLPVTVNGTAENFLFDTGGYYTQVSRDVAQSLKLPVHQGDFALYDAAGNVSRDLATLHDFKLGAMHGANLDLPVSTIAEMRGAVALDHFTAMDLDVDFAASKLGLFSPSHCPGRVVWWTSPAEAGTVPLALQGYHAIVSVTLDGHAEKALIDTGAAYSTLTLDEARHIGLVPGATETPPKGLLNGDAHLKTFSHTFNSLSFGDVTVSNPQLALIPNAFGRQAERTALAGNRARSEKDLLQVPDMIIGLDVLRQLHLYFAFGERKLYVTRAPLVTAEAANRPLAVSIPFPPLSIHDRAQVEITWLNGRLAASSDDASLLARRCMMRALGKSELPAALSDCDRALTLKPGVAGVLANRGLVFYQQGSYRAALDGFNQALAADPSNAQALLLRGYAKARLGDSKGSDTDRTAAVTAQAGVVARYQDLGVPPP